MGKNNKARRAAKAKRRAKRGTPRSRGEATQGPAGFDGLGPDPGPDPRFQAPALWLALNTAVDEGAPTQRHAEALASLPARMADPEAEAILARQIDAIWGAGWQPAELRRLLRRRRTKRLAGLLEVAVHADHARRPGQALDERWAAQLRELGSRDVSLQGSWLANWRAAEGLDRATSYLHAAQLIVELGRLPVLDVLIPPPGRPSGAVRGVPTSSSTTGDPMLARVRKLLDKAESTEFEEEATAFTAKAQELMSRHAIDQAAVSAQDAEDTPRMVRLPVDAPYADAKSVLLAEIALANRCRAVYLKGLEMSTVVGHAEDLGLVELLFTSLLVQAQHALAEAGRGQDLGARARSQSFRSSFFLAYASRIGERLQLVTADVLAEAGETSSSALVLRDREHAVEESMDAWFGDLLEASHVRGGYDGVGLAYGRRAADQAALDAGELAG